MMFFHGEDYADTPLVHALIEAMRAKKMSARALGMKAGMSGDAVRNILRGRSASPRESTVRALAEALGISPAVLIEGRLQNVVPRRKSQSSDQETQEYPEEIAIPEFELRWPIGSQLSKDLLKLQQIGTWTVPPGIFGFMKINQPTLCMIAVHNRVWEPHAAGGDRVLVDTSYQAVSQPGLYVAFDAWHSLRKIEDASAAEGLVISGRVIAKFGWL